LHRRGTRARRGETDPVQRGHAAYGYAITTLLTTYRIYCIGFANVTNQSEIMPCLTSWLGPRPHPEERVRRKGAAGSNGRARVSKDEDEPAYSPSCFETHRSALWVWRQLHSR